MKRRMVTVIACLVGVLFAVEEIAYAQVGMAVMAARRLKKRADAQQEAQGAHAPAQETAAAAKGAVTGEMTTCQAQPTSACR